MSNVGKTIWNRGHTECGTVIKESFRRCACCGYSDCLIVKWPDENKTKPCLNGIKILGNGELEIM